MALETGTYISDLVATNPTSTDGKSKGDDHIRLVKATVKATFPNISGAVTSTHTELNKLTGVTATTTELNKLAGLTATTAELNKLSGATPTTAEINRLSGVTSAIQTQINTLTTGKADTNGESYTGAHDFSAASGVTLPAATTVGNVSATELGYLDGVTSAIQTQFSNMDSAKADVSGETYTGTHDFTGTTAITVPTRVVGTSGAYAASVDFVNSSLISANSSLPGQVGNGGKFLKTDGTNPTWAYVMAYEAKAVTFTAGATDSGKWFDCSAALTVNFDSAATLGTSWYCYVANHGGGVVTLDPSGAETVAGAAALTVNIGEVYLVLSNGTNLLATLIQRPEWSDKRVVIKTVSGNTWTVPANCYAIRAYVFGAGGAGAAHGTTAAGGGGGSCTYGTIPTTPGTVFTFGIAASVVTLKVGATTYLTANSGTAGSAGTAGTGGAAGSVGAGLGIYDSGAYAGGNGGASVTGGGSGGGGAGSPLGTGGDGGATSAASTAGGGGGFLNAGGAGGTGAGGGAGTGGAGGTGVASAAGGGAGSAASGRKAGLGRGPASYYTDPLLAPCVSPGGAGAVASSNGISAGPGGGGGAALSGSYYAGSGGLGGGGGGCGSANNANLGGDGGFGGGGGGADPSGAGSIGGAGGIGGGGGGGDTGGAGGSAAVVIFY